MELAFSRLPGVTRTRVGYLGGKAPRPSYEAVCTGTTGHAEAVQVTFDDGIVSYDDLLNVFWEIHDPTTLNRQGNGACLAFPGPRACTCTPSPLSHVHV